MVLFTEKLMNSASLAAALFDRKDYRLLYKNAMGSRCAAFDVSDLVQLLGSTAPDIIKSAESDGFTEAIAGASQFSFVRLNIACTADGFVVICGEPLLAPIFNGQYINSAAVCREIVRSGICSIYYASEALDEAAETKTQKSCIREIKNRSYEILRLQENSEIGAGYLSGHLTPNKTYLSLDQLICSLCKTVSMVAYKIPKITFTSSGDCDTMADVRLIECAVLNLLANSISFRCENTEISVSVDRRGSNIVINVNDTGHGIKHELLSKVILPYHSYDPYNDGAPRPGVGLGLTVVAAAARAHGGSFVISSEFSKGTSVSITIPYESSQSLELKQFTPVSYIKDCFSRVYILLSGCCELA